MFDSLATLANANARRIGLVAIGFFFLAAAIGGGVASKLDPYGAEDPATETVKAMDRLQEAGLRVPAVVNGPSTRSPPMAKRSCGPGCGSRRRPSRCATKGC